MKSNRNLKQNDEAVSPVIGVILMVAITVILAAVIGAFVFGMGPPEAAPQASLRASGFIANPAQFSIEHQGGDEIDTVNTVTKLLIKGVAQNQTSGAFSSAGGKFSVGEVITINPETNNTIASGDKITLVDIVSQKPIATFTVRT